MDGLEGCFQILHYNSMSGGGIRAVIEIVQIGSKLGGTYRFDRHDSGEVSWGPWPQCDGDVVGEERGELAHLAPDGMPWRWRLSLAGTDCFARRLEDGRIRVAQREDARIFDDDLEPFHVSAGEPYRDLARSLQAMIEQDFSTNPVAAAELRKMFVSDIGAALPYHPVILSTIPDIARLVGGDPVELRALLEAAEREALREERAHFDRMREAWEPRLRDLVPFPVPPPAPPPLPVVEDMRERELAEPVRQPMKRRDETTVSAVEHVDTSVVGQLVNAATALAALQNRNRGELLIVIRDGTIAKGTSVIGSRFSPTAMMAESVNAVPFDSLTHVESAWQAFRAAFLGAEVELRTDRYAPVEPLRQTDLGAVLDKWYAQTFQTPSTSERQALVAAAINAGCLFIGGFEAMTQHNAAVRLAVLAGSNVAMLVYYTGDGP